MKTRLNAFIAATLIFAGLFLFFSPQVSAQGAQGYPLVRTTIAGMQALGASSPFYGTVYVQGYNTGSPYGGGTFYWNSSSTATADNCTIFPATGVTTGRWIRLIPDDVLTVDMCGALGNGSSDDGAAINFALATGYSRVALLDRHYQTSVTIRYQMPGQILEGQGHGAHGENGLTVLTYTGTAGKPLVSFARALAGYNLGEITLRDMDLEGGGLASPVVQVYDSTSSPSSGNWRGRLDALLIEGAQAGGIGVDLGSTVGGPFGNDMTISNTYIFGASTCVIGAGSLLTLENKTTLQACSTYGVNMLPGSVWTINDVVMTGNGWDLKGSNIQGITSSGTWYENSTYGVAQFDTAVMASFTGGFMHTFNASRMIDWGASAGTYGMVNVSIANGTSSRLMANINSGAQRCFQGSFVTPSDGVGCFQSGNTGSGQGYTYSGSGTLTNGQTVTVTPGRGSWLVSVVLYNTVAATSRLHEIVPVSLFDGDSQVVGTPILNVGGSVGTLAATITTTSNTVVLTYTGGNTVNAAISVTGAKAN